MGIADLCSHIAPLEIRSRKNDAGIRRDGKMHSIAGMKSTSWMSAHPDRNIGAAQQHVHRIAQKGYPLNQSGSAIQIVLFPMIVGRYFDVLGAKEQLRRRARFPRRGASSNERTERRFDAYLP